MAFFSKFKRAFGFDDNGDELDDELDIAVPSNSRSNSFNDEAALESDVKPAVIQPAPTVRTDATIPENADGLINAVVQLVNENVPAAMRQYINLNEQRESVKNALAHHIAAVSASSQSSADEMKNKLMMSETQRKAAQARANELVGTISKLEAENERLDIERKALQNKVKVMQVKGVSEPSQVELDAEKNANELKEVREQNRILQQELEQAKKEVAQERMRSEAVPALESEVKVLKESNTELSAEISRLNAEVSRASSIDNATLEQIKIQLADEKEKNVKLTKQIEQFNKNAKINREKQNRRDIDLANRIDGLKSQLASAAVIVESAQKANDEKDKENHDLAELLAAANKRIQQLEASKPLPQQTVRKPRKKKVSPPSHTDDIAVEEEKTSTEPKVDETPVVKQNSDHIVDETLIPAVDDELANVVKEKTTSVTTEDFAPVPELNDEILPDIDGDDDIDWLIPVSPDAVLPEPEPEPEPEVVQRPSDDPRQLSLW